MRDTETAGGSWCLPSGRLRVRVVRRVYLADLLRIGLFFYSLIQQRLLSLMVDLRLACDVLVPSAVCNAANTGLKERIICTEYAGSSEWGGGGWREEEENRVQGLILKHELGFQGGRELVMKDGLLAHG